MKVYVTGGTGFVGRAVVRELVARGAEARLLVRPGSEGKLGDLRERVETVPGDVLDAAAHEKALDGCDACIHLVGIIREYPWKGVTYDRLHVKAVDALVSAMKDSGVERLVHMSALGTRAGAASRYHATKWAGERIVRYSGLSWSLFQPSVLLGPEGGFFRMLKDLASSPVAPLPGGGTSLFRPLPVESAASALVTAAMDGERRFEGRTYEAGGGEDVTLRTMVEAVAKASGRRVPRILAVPALPLRLAAALLDWMPWFPVTRDQLTMMREGSVPREGEAFFSDFGIEKVPFDRLIDHCVNDTPLNRVRS